MKCQPHLYASNWSIMSFVDKLALIPLFCGFKCPNYHQYY
jgi:hypothetical protein